MAFGAYIKLLLAYCMYIGALFNKWQLKDRFAPIDSSVEVPALPIAICCENNNAMHRFTDVYIYVFMYILCWCYEYKLVLTKMSC